MRVPDRRTAALATLALGLLAALVGAGGSSAQAATPATYALSPSPVAAPGSLAAGASVTVTLTATRAGGALAGGATVYLSFAPTTGGGTLTSHGQLVGATATPEHANSLGQVKMTFKAPAVLPATGSDVVTAANAATGPTLVAQDSYTYGSSSASAGDWPMFHLNPGHSGVSTDTKLGAAYAPSLKLLWSATTAGSCPNAGCAQVVSSPVVVYNATLGVPLAYLADYWGDVFAYNAVTGAKVWSQHLGGKILGSPAVWNGLLFIGSANHRMFELNAATGAQVCSLDTGGIITSAPVVADPGTGAVVYFGDHGLVWQPPQTGHLWAMNPAGCSVKWSWDAFGSPPGSMTNLVGEWSQPGFGVDATGRPLVVFGSANEDDEIYALDANTGATVWQFQTLKGTDTDVGAGPTISAPGVNGFADGVVYETGKDKITYALDLTTGQQIWSFNIKAANPGPQGDTVSVAALDGTNLFLGWGAGLYDLNAVTGLPVWEVKGLPEIATSPAVSGAPGDKIVFAGDVGGGFHAYDMSGNELFAMNTGGSVFGSPAVSNGRVYFTDAATDTLYAFG
jgi:eukaryotic-like serine/threonine-protein kinase